MPVRQAIVPLFAESPATACLQSIWPVSWHGTANMLAPGVARRDPCAAPSRDLAGVIGLVPVRDLPLTVTPASRPRWRVQGASGDPTLASAARPVLSGLMDPRNPDSPIVQERLRNFSIIAHIDHGKSTLADRLLEFTHTIDPRQMTSQVLDSMDLEREKGITIKARAVRLEHTAEDGLVYGLNLIDTPGHVDFAYEVSHSLQACEGAILVVDAAQGIEAQTLANVHLALRQDLVIIPVLNKIDLPSAQPDVVIDELENVLAIPREEVILASAKEGIGIAEILEAIVRRIPPPKGSPKARLQALVFDSHYDQYKGVVTYVRLAAGTLHEHERIRLMGSGAEAEILELGVFRPQLVPVHHPDRRRGRLHRDGPQERARRAGRRHRHQRGRTGGRAAPRLPGRQEPGLRGHLPDLGRGLPAPPRRDGEAAPQRRQLHVRAGELDRPRVRLPLRLPGAPPHGDRPGAPGARVQPRPDRIRAIGGVPRHAPQRAGAWSWSTTRR